MPLMILGFIGFILATLFWLCWAALWLVVALFWVAWPLTLLVLACIAWRVQSRLWPQEQRTRAAKPERARPSFRQSGNAAFDEYREETLRRLDEEHETFRAFLERLRKAKDKEAFDRFVAERRGRTDGPQGAPA